MLEQQLDWIGRRYQFIGLDELAAGLTSGKPFDRPVAAVTFDDGYADVYEHGLPLLRRKGIPGAAFVVTDFVGTNRLHAYDRLYLLFTNARNASPSVTAEIARILVDYGVSVLALRGRTGYGDPYAAMRACITILPPARLESLVRELEIRIPPDPSDLRGCRALNWEMVAALQRGGFTIGSHTRRHVLLPSQSPRVVVDEATGSRRDLERKLGTTVQHIAYPDGRFTNSVLRMIARAGYTFGYTTCGYRDPDFPLLTLPRRVLWEHSCVDAWLRFSPAIMSCQLNGVFDPFGRCPHDHQGLTTSLYQARPRIRRAGTRPSPRLGR